MRQYYNVINLIAKTYQVKKNDLVFYKHYNAFYIFW